MEIRLLIAELLYQTNCLVLPQFGGFIANQLSAKYDQNLRQFQPPTRVFSFNANVSNNDGFLIHALADKLNVSYQDAEKRVQAFVLEAKFDLDQGKRITFDNVGFLVKNKEGFVVFEQDRFLNLLRSSYGLGQVRFIENAALSGKEHVNVPDTSPSKTVETSDSNKTTTNHGLEPTQEESISLTDSKHKKTASSNTVNSSKLHVVREEKKAVVSNEEHSKKSQSKESSTGSLKMVKRIAKVAAVAALLPMAFYSFWIPMKTNFLESKVLYLEDFNPLQNNLDKASVYYKDSLHDVSMLAVEKDPTFSVLMNQLEEGKSTFVFPITEDRYFHVTNRISAPILKNENTTSTPIAKVEHSNTTKIESSSVKIKEKGFHLIAGCFGDAKNAQKQVEELKSQGFDAFIVDQNKGLHRVSAAFSKSRNDLEAKRTKLKSNGINAWVLKK